MQISKTPNKNLPLPFFFAQKDNAYKHFRLWLQQKRTNEAGVFGAQNFYVGDLTCLSEEKLSDGNGPFDRFWDWRPNDEYVYRTPIPKHMLSTPK